MTIHQWCADSTEPTADTGCQPILHCLLRSNNKGTPTVIFNYKDVFVAKSVFVSIGNNVRAVNLKYISILDFWNVKFILYLQISLAYSMLINSAIHISVYINTNNKYKKQHPHHSKVVTIMDCFNAPSNFDKLQMHHILLKFFF